MRRIKPRKMARLLGVSVRTLKRWDKDGSLPAHRTPSNRRYYTEEQYASYNYARTISTDQYVPESKVTNTDNRTVTFTVRKR